MPSLGSIKRSCVAGVTREVKAFAFAFQEVLPRVLPGATMAERAQALGVSPSLLSHWMHGRRLPRLEVMPALRRLTRSTQVDATGRLGEDLARAERLLQEARGTSCRSRVGVGGCGGERMEGDRRNSVDDAVGGGDRRNSVLADEVESHSLVYLAALPPAARTNSLRSLGASLCEEEIGLLVAALRRSRMNDEVEVVLRSAESAGLDTVKVALVVLECSWG